VSRLGLRLHADEEHWIPLSDLMTGLMFLFLLVALAYMVEVDVQHAGPRAALTTYLTTRSDLYRDLYAEFHDDLSAWGATIDPKTLSIRFYARNVLFAPGSAELQPRFKTILDDFFPRYVRILNEPKYRDIVSELRIEGYTSSFWHSGATVQQSYIANMALSQDRTRSVLNYALGLRAVAPDRPWLMQVLTANGLSFSHLIRHADGTEDAAASQRVEFRVRTNAEEQVRQALAVRTPPPVRAEPQRTPAAATYPPIPVVDQSMPPYPRWAQPMIGKPLRTFFPNLSTHCLGYLDSALVRYAGTREGIELRGWAYDTDADAPVRRVVFANASKAILDGKIAGAADGGFRRPDVPAALPQIESMTTGWQGYTTILNGRLTAWAILTRPRTACRLMPANPSSGAGM
jgi:outer membrane protein OmpA-like peptidoglycan-associated protein